MLDVRRLVASFEEIIGWPYESPGTNDKNGIDCSGAFVRAFRQQGASIYHGSNTIFRQYCTATGKIENVNQLVVGMAVFKHRADNNEPSKYHGDGFGNLYHIGFVISISPLRIIHATSPKAKVDTVLGNWGYYGFLKYVNYEGGGSMAATDDILYIAVVTAASGSTVNLRKSKDGDLLIRVPVGGRVSVLSESGEWAKVSYGEYIGHMKKEFLRDVESIPDGSLDKRFFSFLAELDVLIAKYKNGEEA